MILSNMYHHTIMSCRRCPPSRAQLRFSPASTATTTSRRYSSQFENNYLTEICSGSEAGSYLRLIDFVYHSTLGLRLIKKKKRRRSCPAARLTLVPACPKHCTGYVIYMDIKSRFRVLVVVDGRQRDTHLRIAVTCLLF